MTDHTARAGELIRYLDLAPHPEGGWYRETWRHRHADPQARDHATAIHFLLRAGERSHWHRVDAAELWIHGAGDPLHLEWWEEGAAEVTSLVLGQEPASGHQFQAVVPPHAWQAARPLGAWALVHCIVVPAFDFAGFTLAPPDWQPPAPGNAGV